MVLANHVDQTAIIVLRPHVVLLVTQDISLTSTEHAKDKIAIAKDGVLTDASNVLTDSLKTMTLGDVNPAQLAVTLAQNIIFVRHALKGTLISNGMVNVQSAILTAIIVDRRAVRLAIQDIMLIKIQASAKNAKMQSPIAKLATASLNAKHASIHILLIRRLVPVENVEMLALLAYQQILVRHARILIVIFATPITAEAVLQGSELTLMEPVADAKLDALPVAKMLNFATNVKVDTLIWMETVHAKNVIRIA